MSSDATQLLKTSVKVLLVEGKAEDYQFIQYLLIRTPGADCSVTSVQTFDDAKQAADSAEFDICLLDEHIADNQTRDLSLPMIVLATEDDYQADLQAMWAGAYDFLIKSQLSAELLERAIRYAMDRKRIEIELTRRTSKEHNFLAAAIENLSVSVLITDPNQPDNPLVFHNPAFTETTGYTSEEVLGRNLRFLAHAASDPNVLQEIRTAVEERQVFKGVMLNRRKDGTLYRNSMVICPVFNDQEELMNFVGLSEDVTAQYQAQEALLESEKRYAGMVANVPGVIYRALRRADGTAEFRYMSEGCRTLFGITPEDFLGDALTLRRLVHPDDLLSYELASLDANANAQPWRWLGRFVLPSGEEKIIQGMAHPDAQPNGEVIWDGLLMDVTERVQHEQKAAQLAAIVEGSNDAIMGKTLGGIVTSWNAAAERMYGYTAEEMVDQPLARLLPDDRPREVDYLIERIARGEVVQSFETVRRAKNGTLLDVSLTISPIKDTAGRVTGASTIAHDISLRKKAEAQIEQQMMRIQALRNIDMAITGSLDLRVTLNVLLDQVTTHLRVDSAAVLLLNPHTHRLEYEAGRGFRTTALQRTRLRIGEGFAGRAAMERRILNIPDLNQDPGDFVRAPLITGEGFVSYWVAPLITKGRIEGVLEIFHRAPLNGDGNWLSFLETLAGQAAIAIENAALFNDLQRSNVELQVAYDSTLEGWSKALDLRDKETEGHTLRVTEATMTLARAMDISGDDLIHMRRGALLHDIGKMGIPDSILLKPGPLTAEEWVIMKKHPVYAYELLSPIRYLKSALDIPYCHHERWDGSGYPRGLKGEQIPLSARLFCIVDVWDALTSDRPYRSAWPASKVRDHIAQGSGTHFEPHIVDIFLNTEM